MNQFIEFYNPVRIIFGNGCLKKVGFEAKNLGSKALIVLGKKSMRKTKILDQLIHALRLQEIDCSLYENVLSDPSVEIIDEGTCYAKKENCNLVIGIGGGSVLDAGKAIAAMINHPGSVAEYQEIEGANRKFLHKTIPFIAIPTTSGTGSEATKNAVITNKKRGLKKSIRDNRLFPKIALIDPELTVSLPPRQTAICGGDALTQCIESYLGKKSQFFTDILALEGIKLIRENLTKCVKTGNDLKARNSMSMAALLSGICLSNSGLGFAHALSHPLGIHYKIPHGLSCASLLPYVMQYDFPYRIKKLVNIAQALGINTSRLTDMVAAETAIEKIKEILSDIGIESHLHSWQILKSDFPKIIRESQGGNLKNNPGNISEQDLYEILLKII